MANCDAALIIPNKITKPWAGSDLRPGIGESIEFGDNVEFSYNDGRRSDPDEKFPVMSKFISTSDWLSVQVHPNDEQAQKLEGLNRGKFEAWYIMKTPPEGAEIICGPAIGDDYTRRTVRPGDVVFIEPGTVHAIGPNILLWEIQQNCNITYRIHDWGRDRRLHTEKANLVMTDKVAEIIHPENGIIIDNEHFKVTLLELDGPVPIECDGRPMILTNLCHYHMWLSWENGEFTDSISTKNPSTIYLEKDFKGILDGSGTYCITTW